MASMLRARCGKARMAGVVRTRSRRLAQWRQRLGAELFSGEGNNVFKQIYACMSCVAMLILASSMAEAQTREATLSEVSVRGTVQAIDHTARTVTVQGEGGNVVTLDVPTTAARFDQVRVGDIVAMTYYDRVSVRAKPADEAAVNRVLEPT